MKTIRETSNQVIERLLKNFYIREGEKVLEPSAGYGLLADGIREKYPNVDLECVELNQTCKDTLKEKGYNVVGSDFFLFNPSYQYDYVIGAPNFRGNIDCKHVMKMYELLKLNGIVSSIMSPYWMTGDSELQINFRKWLEDKHYNITILSDNTFMEDGKTVPTIIIQIRKYETV